MKLERESQSGWEDIRDNFILAKFLKDDAEWMFNWQVPKSQISASVYLDDLTVPSKTTQILIFQPLYKISCFRSSNQRLRWKRRMEMAFENR